MWSSVIPFVAVTLVLFFVPGTLVNLAGGFRPLSAVGFAPLVSTGIIAVAAIAGQLVGLDWGPIPIVITTIASIGLGLAVRLALRRLGIVGRTLTADQQTRLHPGWPIAGVLIGAGIIGRDMLVILGSPTNFSQTFDNIFHLNAVRWITEHRQGSALDMRMSTGLDVPAGFYPTAWHDIASATLLSMGVMDPVRATSALLIVVCAVVWPLSCMLLVRRMIVPTAVNQLAIGVLAASFSAFPYLLVGFGVLYPNLLGLCLLPAIMALGLDILDLSPISTPAPAATWAAALIGMAGLGLAHPNVALVVLDVVGVIMVVYWAVPAVYRAVRTRQWDRPTKVKLVVLVGWLGAAMVALKVVRPPITAGRWANPRGLLDAIIETASVSPLEATIVLVPALLTLLGIVVPIVRRRYILLVLLHSGLCFLWFVAAAVPISFFRDLITGPWYSDPYRLASLLPISALPLAVVGVDFIVEKVSFGRLATLPRAAVAAAVAVVLIATTQFGSGKRDVVEWTREHYEIRTGGNLVSLEEYELIQRLPELVPAGDVVAVDPWNGSSMAYALVGTQTTLKHVLFDATDNDQIIIDHLSAINQLPEVCRALDEENVHWVLDFGNVQLVNQIINPYPGWFHLAVVRGFEPVASEGTAVLYKVTACG